MLNIGIIIDSSWDNYMLIHKKFKKINNEYFRIHTLYGKTLEIINNCCINNYLTILRHYSNNLCKTIFNLLQICDLWLIFTNHIEYNTQSRLTINKCDEYNLKYIIISEYTNIDLYSYDYNKNLSFKKNLQNITKINKNNDILEFDYKYYNDNFYKCNFVPLNLSQEIRNKLKHNYNDLNKNKNDNAIKLLYDKDELKREKQLKKTIKEVSQFDFNKNRLNYYKNIK